MAVQRITDSIEAREWGDVRSYLDEYDGVLQSDPAKMNAVREKANLGKQLSFKLSNKESSQAL